MGLFDRLRAGPLEHLFPAGAGQRVHPVDLAADLGAGRTEGVGDRGESRADHRVEAG